jgi:hypothetical protein
MFAGIMITPGRAASGCELTGCEPMGCDMGSPAFAAGFELGMPEMEIGPDGGLLRRTVSAPVGGRGFDSAGPGSGASTITDGKLSIETTARAAGGAALTLRAFSLAGVDAEDGGGGAGSGPGATAKIAPGGGGGGGTELGPEVGLDDGGGGGSLFSAAAAIPPSPRGRGCFVEAGGGAGGGAGDGGGGGAGATIGAIGWVMRTGDAAAFGAGGAIGFAKRTGVPKIGF